MRRLFDIIGVLFSVLLIQTDAKPKLKSVKWEKSGYCDGYYEPFANQKCSTYAKRRGMEMEWMSFLTGLRIPYGCIVKTKDDGKNVEKVIYNLVDNKVPCGEDDWLCLCQPGEKYRPTMLPPTKKPTTTTTTTTTTTAAPTEIIEIIDPITEIIDLVAIDGGYTEWSDYSECSTSCGDGIKTRTRTCTAPEPENGGLDCQGPSTETAPCSKPCPVDGGYSEFGDWTECSRTCGRGVHERRRACDNPAPANGGADCVGKPVELRDCNADVPCPIDGGLSLFGPFGPCSVTCGGGVQIRSRHCTKPAPAHGGKGCVGELEETRKCNTVLCPKKVVKPARSKYFKNYCEEAEKVGKSCKVTEVCEDHGILEIKASVVGRDPKYLKKYTGCKYVLVEAPVDGGLSKWGAYTKCSATCGGGTQQRARACNNPAPAHGGKPCVGDLLESRTCNNDPCPTPDPSKTPAPVVRVNGGYSDFGPWSKCSRSCGRGVQERSRTCSNPPPSNGGATCAGPTTETQSCSVKACAKVVKKKIWNRYIIHWCRNMRRMYRGRCQITETCLPNGILKSVGRLYLRRFQKPYVQWQRWPVSCKNGRFGAWTPYGACSKTCGGGEQIRTRACDSPAPSRGTDCVGPKTEYQKCNTQACPTKDDIVHGNWGAFGDWTTCTATCNGGTQKRTRACDSPAPLYGGNDCAGSAEETRACNTQHCPPINGGFGLFGSWSECSVTCGEGKETRTRQCNSPVPANGGADCVGEATESRDCEKDGCPEPCEDKNEKCAYWAEHGECKINPFYMLKKCRLSCKYCQCEDQWNECESYKDQGYCAEEKLIKNWKMIQNCGQACGLCPKIKLLPGSAGAGAGAGGAVDKSCPLVESMENCDNYVQSGSCKNPLYTSWMKRTCCGFCEGWRKMPEFKGEEVLKGGILSCKRPNKVTNLFRKDTHGNAAGLKAACLNAANWYRRKHPDTPDLEYDDDIAKAAQAYADHMTAKYSGYSDITHDHDVNHANHWGENIYLMNDHPDFSTMENIVEYFCMASNKDWYSEIFDYDFNTGAVKRNIIGAGPIGHFTQMVWKETRKVGFGIGMRKLSGHKSVIYVISKYYPAGNFEGKFQVNVVPRKHELQSECVEEWTFAR